MQWSTGDTHPLAHPSPLLTIHRPTRLHGTTLHRPTRLHGTTFHRPTRLYHTPCPGPPVSMGQPSTGLPVSMGQPSTGPPVSMGQPSTGPPVSMGQPSPGLPVSMGQPSTGLPVSMGQPSTGPPVSMGQPSTGPPICITHHAPAHPSPWNHCPPAHPSVLHPVHWPKSLGPSVSIIYSIHYQYLVIHSYTTLYYIPPAHPFPSGTHYTPAHSSILLQFPPWAHMGWPVCLGTLSTSAGRLRRVSSLKGLLWRSEMVNVSIVVID